MDTQEQTTPTTTNGVEEPMKRRISKLSSQRREALAQVADLEAANAALEKRVATAEALAGRVAELEQQLRIALGTRVEIRQTSPGRGRLVIHFNGHAEFERIRDSLVGAPRRQAA